MQLLIAAAELIKCSFISRLRLDLDRHRPTAVTRAKVLTLNSHGGVAVSSEAAVAPIYATLSFYIV